MKYKKKKSPLSSLYSTRIIETFKIREARDFIFHENSFLFSSSYVFFSFFLFVDDLSRHREGGKALNISPCFSTALLEDNNRAGERIV